MQHAGAGLRNAEGIISAGVVIHLKAGFLRDTVQQLRVQGLNGGLGLAADGGLIRGDNQYKTSVVSPVTDLPNKNQ